MSQLESVPEETVPEVFRAGDEILTEVPWVYTVSSCEVFRRCYRCLAVLDLTAVERSSWDGPVGQAKSKCSGCKFAHYCSVTCQSKDWKETGRHKAECGILKHLPPGLLPPNHFLIMLKILLEFHRKGKTAMLSSSKEFSSPHGKFRPKKRTYADLVSHSAELRSRPETVEYIPQLHRMLQHYISQGVRDFFIPFSPKDALDMLGKIMCNSFVISNEEMAECGVGVYLEASALDHSCQPNACQIFYGPKLVIKSQGAIADAADVRISYTDRMWPARIRQDILRITYFFTCTCARCSDLAKDAEMFPLQCANAECQEPIPSDGRADLSCLRCGTKAHERLSETRQELFERLVGDVRDQLVTVRDGKVTNKSGGSHSDWQLMELLSTVLHASNPILAFACNSLANRLMESECDDAKGIAPATSSPKTRRAALLLARAAELYRKLLPVVDPLLGHVLLNAAMTASLAETQSTPQEVYAMRNKKKEWLEEARRSLAMTYGENHSLYQQATAGLRYVSAFRG